MQRLTELPGVTVHEPFHFYDTHKQPTQCNLLVQEQAQWVVATERPDGKGQGLWPNACMLAEAVCSKFGLNPLQLILLLNYPSEQEPFVFSVHFKRVERDMFAGLVFHQAYRTNIKTVDLAEVVKMLREGNKEESILRAILPVKLTSAGSKQGK